MVSGPLLEAPAGLLARWGIPADAELTRAESGCNNQTFAVAYGGGRWVLRISQNLSAAQARAEHRLLGRLRTADLPFGVPEPVAALSGDTVAETPAGPATLCRWIPGVRPDLAADPGDPPAQRRGAGRRLKAAAGQIEPGGPEAGADL